MYTCPVCGYNELTSPPEDWEICPSCNTEFGYNDINWGVDALRRDWIESGARWSNPEIQPPLGWSAIEQLRNINYEVTDADKIAIAHESGPVVTVKLVFEQEHYRVVRVAAQPTITTAMVQFIQV